VINAVCHRDYLEQGAQVMVEVFDDRVEIYNPGGLPKGLTAKDFGRRSVCRNPRIAGLLLRCNYIEKMGSGIERIREALAKENCPEVRIRYNTMFTLDFPRPTYKEEDLGRAIVTSEKTSEKVSEKTSEKIVRHILADKDMTIADLAEAIGVTTRTIERNIQKLQSAGRLRRVGPDKGGWWEVEEN
jgi:ATP-dependent DNA helicase RecG